MEIWWIFLTILQVEVLIEQHDKFACKLRLDKNLTT